MADVSHQFGQDISISAGDIALVAGSDATVQRILRRLLTNPGDYIWHPEYGAGLGAYIGETFDQGALTGLISAQILLEDAVAADPAPVVNVSSTGNGNIYVGIQYADNISGQSQTVTFAVSA